MRDAAAMAAQSDPLKNQHFRRRWGPPLDRSGRRVIATTTRSANPKDSSSGTEHSYSHRLLQAFRLDRLADQELAIGRTHQAERLAHEAQALREGGR
jgi:hypothetical protein